MLFFSLYILGIEINSFEDISAFPVIPDKRPGLKKNLDLYGLGIHGRTPKDGNCFFHSVADQMKQHGFSMTAARLRSQTVSFMEKMPKVCLNFLNLHTQMSVNCAHDLQPCLKQNIEDPFFCSIFTIFKCFFTFTIMIINNA